jgi:hypothetical protein
MVTFGRKSKADAGDPALRAAAEGLAKAALVRVQDPATGRVRVEDYLTVIASVAGEAALVSAGVFDIEKASPAPGSPVFGDQINRVLSGDTANPAAVPPDSVFGLLVRELVPTTVAFDDFPSLMHLYRLVASGVGAGSWGTVPLSVLADHHPTVLPLQVAFELRPTVAAACKQLRLPDSQRQVLCTIALADALRQVVKSIDMRLALCLALEIVFGTAKMTPMSQRAFTAARSTSKS